MSNENRKRPDRNCGKCAGRGVMKRSIHSDYEPCDCTKVPEKFKPGEHVTFTIARRRGLDGFYFVTRVGTVIEDDGETVSIKRRGVQFAAPKTDVRRLGEKSALTEAFEKMADEVSQAGKGGA